ncbi:MAG: MerR family transcriptional regulator [Pseudonocardiaceae bacterium]
MTPGRPTPQSAGPISSILANVRRGRKHLHRQSRDVLAYAVSQLFDAATHPGSTTSGEYRIDDLAREAGTTTRNVRVYRDRGLLPPPLRIGRVAIYNDTHLTRLRLITSMLDRGYNLAHVDEMLSAWEQGKNLGDVLGLETALVGTWVAEKPETMSRDQAERLIGDKQAFDRLVALRVIRITDDKATITQPKLIESFNDVRQYGIGIHSLIDVHEQVLPHIEQIATILVNAGAEHVADRIEPGHALPDDGQIAELLTMLVKLRTQAVTSVTATLASSIESTIESMVGRLLADFIATTQEPDTEAES